MATQILDITTRLAELGLGQGWTWDKGSWWLNTTEDFDLRATTEKLISLDARFIAITAIEQDDKQIRLDYQWDLEGALLSFTTATKDGQIPSIADLSPAADWVERETYEYFSVVFTGRASLLPLMTRTGDPTGINLRPTPEVAQ
jgi:hypothetical protein